MTQTPIYFGDAHIKEYHGQAWPIGNGLYVFQSLLGEQITTSFMELSFID